MLVLGVNFEEQNNHQKNGGSESLGYDTGFSISGDGTAMPLIQVSQHTWS